MAIFNGWRITRTGVVFVLGIIVLTAAVFGGIWFVHDRGEQARRQEAAKIAQQNLEEQSKPTTNTSTGNGTVTPPTTEAESETPATGTTNSAALPETGADPSQVIIVTLLTLAGAYYATSRRAAREL